MSFQTTLAHQEAIRRYKNKDKDRLEREAEILELAKQIFSGKPVRNFNKKVDILAGTPGNIRNLAFDDMVENGRYNNSKRTYKRKV